MCLEDAKILKNLSFLPENGLKFESATSWRRSQAILPFLRKNIENTEGFAALWSVKTGTNSAMPAQNVENYRFLLEGLLFAQLTVSLRGF